MIRVKIALITDSEIISAGLRNILSHIHDIAPTVRVFGSNDSVERVREFMPNLIIADPLAQIVYELREQRNAERIKIIALYHSALPKSLLDNFDASISIYDNSRVISDTILKSAGSDSEEEEAKVLSQREKEVVIGIVKGLSNKEIASEINVSVNTVMTHRRNIASKLQIHSPAGLTIYAIVSKLVSLEDIKSNLPK